MEKPGPDTTQDIDIFPEKSPENARRMIPPPACQERADMKVGYVYLLRSVKRDKFYLGWTTDLNRRLTEHNLGKSRYTKSRGPWELVGYERYSNPQVAKLRERTLKRNPRMLSLFKKRALTSRRDPTTQGWLARQVVG